LGLLSFCETPKFGVLLYEILFELFEGAVPAVPVIIPLFLQVIGQFFFIALVNGCAAEANAQDIDSWSYFTFMILSNI
jgi:hypothetical protein